MPFRDTPRERKFAERSIPSAISLNPDEFVIGVDAPADKSLVDLVHNLCRQHDFKDYRILEVPRSAEWKLQLANIIWHCYKICKHDRILAFDVDSVLRPAVMRGLDVVGRDNNAVVSFTKKLLIKTLGDLVRHIFYRLRIRCTSFVFSGIYWIYRPSYYAAVDLYGMMSISNGIDAYMLDRILELNRHVILTFKEIGVDCMDYQNEDYPWRQFQDGIWYYANKGQFCDPVRYEDAFKNSHRVRRIGSVVWRRCPALLILLKSTLNVHPWVFRGWLWARKNSEHEAVLQARDSTQYAWNMKGSKHVKHLHNWGKHGRLGTGFD